jgi:SAM-dependent methyltransferase
MSLDELQSPPRGTRDELRDDTAARQDVDLVTYVLAQAGAPLGERVLDHGCGTGLLTGVLAEHADQVVGVDVDGDAVRLARRRNRHQGRVEFQHQDGPALPFPDGGFDSAVSLAAVQHLTGRDQVAALLELCRVVRPGGMLVLQVPDDPKHPAPLDPAACRPEFEVLSAPTAMPPAGQAVVRVRVGNASPLPWPRHRLIKLGNHWLADGEVRVLDDGRALLPHELGPGESVLLELAVTAPDRPGDYQLELDVVAELVTWFAEAGGSTVRLPVSVAAGAEVALSGPGVPPGTPLASPRATDPSTVEDSGEGRPISGMPVDLVRGLLTQCGARVLNVYEDELAGHDWRGYVYVVQV